jgi:hypothetical protein
MDTATMVALQQQPTAIHAQLNMRACGNSSSTEHEEERWILGIEASSVQSVQFYSGISCSCELRTPSIRSTNDIRTCQCPGGAEIEVDQLAILNLRVSLEASFGTSLMNTHRRIGLVCGRPVSRLLSPTNRSERTIPYLATTECCHMAIRGRPPRHSEGAAADRGPSGSVTRVSRHASSLPLSARLTLRPPPLPSHRVVPSPLEATSEVCVASRRALYGSGATPTARTASQLAGFHAVVAFSDPPFADPVLMGDRLTAYHDQGGVMVVACYANMASWALQGDYGSQGSGYSSRPRSGGLHRPLGHPGGGSRAAQPHGRRSLPERGGRLEYHGPPYRGPRRGHHGAVGRRRAETGRRTSENL